MVNNPPMNRSVDPGLYTQGVTNVFLATTMDMTVWSAGNYTVTVQAGNAAGYGPACTTTIGV